MFSCPDLVVAEVSALHQPYGRCSNAVVLAVLVRSRRQAGSSAHILIANQSAMDLFTCVFAMVSLVLMLTHGFEYDGDAVLDGALCVLFDGGAFTALGLTAEIMGLMVITVAPSLHSLEVRKIL